MSAAGLVNGLDDVCFQQVRLLSLGLPADTDFVGPRRHAVLQLAPISQVYFQARYLMSSAHKLVAVLGLTVGLSAVMPAVAIANAPDENEQDVATFTKDVLPIFQQSCQRCHRPGTAAPMSLLDYEHARPWARASAQQVATRRMPPWHLDRSIGEYAPDPSLSDEEIATITRWVEGGAPRGNPEDAPPPINLPALGEWTFGEPDLVVSMKEGFAIPAEGADFYPSEVVDPGITEDRYIKWIQVIPEAYCCVHHSHVYAFMPEGEPVPEGIGIGMGSNTGNSVDLIEYAMGNDGDLFPDGTAKVVKAGMLFRFSSHYHPWARKRVTARRSASSSIRRGSSRSSSSPPIGCVPDPERDA